MDAVPDGWEFRMTPSGSGSDVDRVCLVRTSEPRIRLEVDAPGVRSATGEIQDHIVLAALCDSMRILDKVVVTLSDAHLPHE